MSSSLYTMAQKDSVQSTLVTNTNTEKLIDKYSEKITASVAAFSEKLKQPAEHIYKVLVKQQVVKACSTLSILLIGILLCSLAIYGGIKSEWEDPEFYSLFCIFGGLIGVVAVLYGVVNFTDILQGFINPEYGAMQDIISIFK